MKHVPKQSWFKSLAVLLCLVGCVSLGLKKSAANATSANSVARDEASADLPQNQKPQPFNISGRVTRANGSGVSGVALTFARNLGSGSLPGSVVTGADGHWSQSGFETLTSYIVNLSRPGFTFQPAAATFSGARSDLNFEGLTDPFSYGGKVTTPLQDPNTGLTRPVGIGGVETIFSRASGPGRVPVPVTTDSSGRWSQSGFEGDTTYGARPFKQGFDFNPSSGEFRNVKPTSELNFEARVTTFAVSGKVADLNNGGAIGGVTITFSVISGRSPVPPPVVTDARGRWSQSGFDDRTTYEVTPRKKESNVYVTYSDLAFNPAGITFGNADRGRSNLDFRGFDILFSQHGFVKDVIGDKPIEGVEIGFTSTAPNETPPHATMTGPSGAWAQNGFKKGKLYKATVTKPGYRLVRVENAATFDGAFDGCCELFLILEKTNSGTGRHD